jgi:molybdenum-dependent DNA-binding transcriptional regulator ModE
MLQPPRLYLILDTVARAGSIRKAADRLRIASTALNRSILNVEKELGTPLFERLPRGVRLTAAGEVLIATIRRSCPISPPPVRRSSNCGAWSVARCGLPARSRRQTT